MKTFIKSAGTLLLTVAIAACTGDQGQAGTTGPQGPQGPQGPKGDPGPAGPAGPTGATGAIGTQGPAGAAGPAGEIGPAGPTGATGPAGPQGPGGAAGPAGAKGNSLAAVPLETNDTKCGVEGGFEIFLVDAANDPIKSEGFLCNGVAGSAGQQGPQGDQGPAGAPGPQGPQGEVGPQGAQGDRGPQGMAGPQGLQGMKGDTGPQGLQGAKGDTGAMGAQGPKGDTGPQGPKGDTGLRGPPGVDGTSLFAVAMAVHDARCGGLGGLEVFQHDASTNQDTSAGVLCNGAPGAQGPKGDQGPAGPQGATGAPGPMGPQGLQGAVGPQGQQGAKGDMGPRGPQGPKGDQGAAGPAGPPGTGALHQRDARGETLGIFLGPATLAFPFAQMSAHSFYLRNQDNTIWTVNAGTGHVSAGSAFFVYTSRHCSGAPHVYVKAIDPHPQMLLSYLAPEQQEATTQLYRIAAGNSHVIDARSFQGPHTPCKDVDEDWLVRDLVADSRTVPGPYAAPVTIAP